ncbi:bifunctional Vps71-ZNHIT1/Zinc finger [Babesia duncani]|uniref:Bifunctional Vps71-ZNHIT1/Zinc finger n=1 Tax=Babesia duncani TaxID=323732 RepID=A0AAD9PP74_9APIC|nr:bifunctional Vps71-ZNHIT1/Zinc finger [Babesia duncani]
MGKPAVKRGRKRQGYDNDDVGKSLQYGIYKERDTLDLRVVIDQDEVDAAKARLPCWKNAHAGAPSLPARHLCCICGFHANYKCLVCANRRLGSISSYYCGFRCFEIHKDQTCGKAIHHIHW